MARGTMIVDVHARPVDKSVVDRRENSLTIAENARLRSGRGASERFDSERREETGERLSASAWDIAGHPFPPMTRLPYWSHGETEVPLLLIGYLRVNSIGS